MLRLDVEAAAQESRWSVPANSVAVQNSEWAFPMNVLRGHALVAFKAHRVAELVATTAALTARASTRALACACRCCPVDLSRLRSWIRTRWFLAAAAAILVLGSGLGMAAASTGDAAPTTTTVVSNSTVTETTTEVWDDVGMTELDDARMSQHSGVLTL